MVTKKVEMWISASCNLQHRGIFKKKKFGKNLQRFSLNQMCLWFLLNMVALCIKNFWFWGFSISSSWSLMFADSFEKKTSTQICQASDLLILIIFLSETSNQYFVSKSFFFLWYLNPYLSVPLHLMSEHTLYHIFVLSF